jgi:pimeloyl-ACP methyl ester carboxylesterase
VATVAIVLVHGGGYDKRCWDRTLPFLVGDVVAVDLPGRGGRPADLGKVGIAEFVDAVVDEIEARDLRDVVLVGHSLAGLTIPQVAGRIPGRIRALVFVSCTVPRDGQSTYDTLDAEIQAVRDANPPTELRTIDPELAKVIFFNDVDDPELLAWGLSLLVPEAPASISDPMVLSTMPPGVRRVWVRLTRDQIVIPVKQDGFIDNVGGAEVVDLDAGHMAMISRPEELAAILNAV